MKTLKVALVSGTLFAAGGAQAANSKTELKALPDDGGQYEFSTSERVIMAGDIHGNLDALIRILQHSKLVDKSGHWIGGKSVFLSPGDVLDGDKESVSTINYVMQLEKEATAAGGQVITTYGNHEIMVSEGDVIHSTPVEAEAYQSTEPGEDHEKLSIHSYFTPESDAGKWMRSKNQIVKVTQKTSGKTIIGVHAGFSETAFKTSFPEFNATARAWVKYWQYKERSKLLLTDQIEKLKALKKPTKSQRKLIKLQKSALKDLESGKLSPLDENGNQVKMPPKNTAWVMGYDADKQTFNESDIRSPSWIRAYRITLGKDGKPVKTNNKGALTEKQMQQLLKREKAQMIVSGHEPNPDDRKLGIVREIHSNPNYPPDTVINADTRIGWENDPAIHGDISYLEMDENGKVIYHNDIPRPPTNGPIAQSMEETYNYGIRFNDLDKKFRRKFIASLCKAKQH